MPFGRNGPGVIRRIALVILIGLVIAGLCSDERTRHRAAAAGLGAGAANIREGCFRKHSTHSGTGAPDVIVGTVGQDVIKGRNGNDSLFGLSGRDRLCGGRGDDDLTGGDGFDRLNGGPGFDRCNGEVERKCEG